MLQLLLLVLVQRAQMGGPKQDAADELATLELA